MEILIFPFFTMKTEGGILNFQSTTESSKEFVLTEKLSNLSLTLQITGRAFKFCLTEHTEYEGAEEAPAWIKALARWRFDKPTKYRMVEEQIGCVLFFRKEEY